MRGRACEFEEKSRAVIEFALGANRSTVRKDDMFRNCQTQSRTSGFPGARLIDPVKPFKKPGKVLRRNSWSVITDVELDAVSSLPCS